MGWYSGEKGQLTKTLRVQRFTGSTVDYFFLNALDHVVTVFADFAGEVMM